MDSVQMSGIGEHLVNHWVDVIAGATFLGIASHALASFPPSSNKYVTWLLGVLQYAVGQRLQGSNNMGATQQMQQSAGKDEATK